MRLFACVMAAAIGMTTSLPAQEEAPKLESVTQKASYQIGMNIGSNLRKQQLPLDADLVAKGVIAGLNGAASPLSEEEMQQVFAALDAEVRKLRAAQGEKNLAAGQKFLAENKEKEGVKVTDSGLQYIVVKEGNGETPTLESTVTTHYRGTLIDGTVFDGSYKGAEPTAADEPISFGVTQVIKGWTEALQMMKVGSHYKLFIPSQLAYGPNGPGQIGANSVLIFDIYLLGVQ